LKTNTRLLFDAEKGAPAKSFRMALGTLIIKEKLGTSDSGTLVIFLPKKG
jgi:hypothetical protein